MRPSTNAAGAIRPECRRDALGWQRPTGQEIRAALQLAGLSALAASRLLGLGRGGDRTVRRWIAQQSPIPYAAWAILCERAGLGLIWIERENT